MPLAIQKLSRKGIAIGQGFFPLAIGLSPHQLPLVNELSWVLSRASKTTTAEGQKRSVEGWLPMECDEMGARGRQAGRPGRQAGISARRALQAIKKQNFC